MLVLVVAAALGCNSGTTRSVEESPAVKLAKLNKAEHLPESNKSIPEVSLEPRSITIDEVKDVVADGYVTAGQLCKDSYQPLCREYGVIS